MTQYKRVLLKLSGEALEGDQGHGIDFEVLEKLCQEIKKIQDMGVEIAIVIGGGNIWRYRDFKDSSLDRVKSDSMGMMATLMNSLALQSQLLKSGVKACVYSALQIPSVAPFYVNEKALKSLEEGSVVICGGGTGNPFFTTDSAASLRALELNCDILLKATNVDFVYDKDPRSFPDAQKFTNISYQEVLERGLQVMDLTAISLCMSKALPILVFNFQKKGNIIRAIQGESIGTLIS